MFLSSGYNPNGEKYHQACSEQKPSSTTNNVVAEENALGIWTVYRLAKRIKFLGTHNTEAEAINQMIKEFNNAGH